MAEQYDNTNSGTLFKNDRREKETHPTHNGSAEVKCPHCGQVSAFWLSAWVKEAKSSGRKFFSLSFRHKEPAPPPPQHAPPPERPVLGAGAQPGNAPPAPTHTGTPGFDDQEIPF